MSSGIQCVLQDMKPFLQKDDYVFVGKVDARACSKNSIKVDINPRLETIFWEYDTCVADLLINSSNGSSTPSSEENLLNNVECWTEFTSALQELPARNIILSDEKLSEVQMQWWGVDKTIQFWKFMKEQLASKYNVHIVMVYRRYHEWLASIKNQGDKYSLGRPHMKLWPPDGPQKEPIFPHLMRWIHNVTEIPSPYTPQMYDLYRNQLQLDVSLLNMHDPTKDMIEDFLCHSLVNAKHTCNEYKQEMDRQRQDKVTTAATTAASRKKYTYTSNPSENHFCDMIAYDAYQQGIIRDLRGYRKGADRIFFNEVISRRLEKMHMTPYDLPLICPSNEELQPLLDITLQYEQDFLPSFYNSEYGKTKIQSKFWKDVSKQKFCTVNTTAVLQQPAWKIFLQQQWRPKRGKKPTDWDYTTYKITNDNFTST